MDACQIMKLVKFCHNYDDVIFIILFLLPSGKEYCRCSLSCPLQLEVQCRKMSLPLPLVINVMGDDWEPMESIKVSEILDPFFPLRMTVFFYKKRKLRFYAYCKNAKLPVILNFQRFLVESAST